MTTPDSDIEGQAMISTDALRLLTGVGAVAAAAGIGVYLVVAGPGNTPAPDFTPNPTVVVTAAQAGIDISNGSPSEDADRLRAVFDQGLTTPADQITFRNGLYFKAATDSEPESNFTGYLATTHGDGSANLIACVVDGQLQGPTVRFHPNGTTQRNMGYKDGQIVGQIIEYFPSGQLKLRAMANGEDSPSGGSSVGELTVGTYNEGTYARDRLGKGRLQLFIGEGKTTNSNTTTPLHEVNGWMLFHNTLITGQKVYTTDSRSITEPS